MTAPVPKYLRLHGTPLITVDSHTRFSSTTKCTANYISHCSQPDSARVHLTKSESGGH